ncbi:type IX secretion system protein PorD [Flavobacterium sp. WC2509]|uniref:type IX secretion system protein PorD n=1 Tax=Flavobacterium sp. WC2509 TaxID=3461406 RepID=UPI004044E697
MIRFILFLFLGCGFIQAQQLNCTVSINTQKISNANQQVFKTLETAITEFVNKTDWTGQVFSQKEKVNCSMFITLSSYSSDQFVANIQVQSSRNIYNSTYSSPVLNINDKDFTFNYTEFENLTYNPTSYSSNLISVLSFYSFVILGMDADTFLPYYGDRYFKEALNITNLAQQGGYKGWNQSDGPLSRYFLIYDLLSPTYADIRQSSQKYYSGLDAMTQDIKKAKEIIKGSLMNLASLNETKPNSYLLRVFMDSKSDEIVSIFTGGPSITITDLVDSLNRTSSANSSKWQLLKY